MAEIIENRNRKGSRFASSCLSTAKDINTVDRWRDCLSLNGGWCFVVEFSKCLLDGRKNIEGIKGFQRYLSLVFEPAD